MANTIAKRFPKQLAAQQAAAAATERKTGPAAAQRVPVVRLASGAAAEEKAATAHAAGLLKGSAVHLSTCFSRGAFLQQRTGTSIAQRRVRDAAAKRVSLSVWLQL